MHFQIDYYKFGFTGTTTRLPALRPVLQPAIAALYIQLFAVLYFAEDMSTI